MDDTQLWQKLSDVFSTVFKARVTLKPDTVAADIPQWDSLNHVKLIVAVEDHFGVKFKHTQIASFETVGDLAKALKDSLASKPQ